MHRPVIAVTQEAEVEEPQIQGMVGLQSEFKASLLNLVKIERGLET